MKSCEKILSEEEINAFFRVCDLDEDGKISYSEFVEAILPFEPYNRRTLALSESKPLEKRSNKFLEEHRKPYHSDFKKRLTDDDYYEYLARSHSAERRRQMILNESVSRPKSKPPPPRYL